MSFQAGQLCLGNDVIALGIGRGLGAGLSTLAGGEVTEVTKLVHTGRKNAYDRLLNEARDYNGYGVAGVSFDMVNHGGNLEFIATGSAIHEKGLPISDKLTFSTSANAQQLYCQTDAGFKPHGFVFGNVAYSIGVGGGIGGALRGLKRGEVPQYSKIFDKTRRLTLERIKQEAKRLKANAVLGIETSIMPLMGTQEMMMMGTASSHPALAAYTDDPVTSDMTNEELWNMVNLGYLPLGLVMGVSVYSLGLAGGIGASLKSLVGGALGNLTEILYEARELAFERIQDDAQRHGADEVIGVKTNVYNLGGGLVEFMAIGTAVKKFDGVTTKHDVLIPQAIIQERETLVDDALGGNRTIDTRSAASARRTQRGPLGIIFTIIFVLGYLWLKLSTPDH